MEPDNATIRVFDVNSNSQQWVHLVKRHLLGIGTCTRILLLARLVESGQTPSAGQTSLPHKELGCEDLHSVLPTRSLELANHCECRISEEVLTVNDAIAIKFQKVSFEHSKLL
jgi:hypothetical protein